MVVCFYSGGIGSSGLLVTTAGNIPVQFVFHLNVNDLSSNNTWNEGIKSCLREAESRKMKSVTFPALGTGKSDLEWTNICLGAWVTAC